MFNKGDRSIYYVSNLVTGKVSIIDGDSYSSIKEVEIGAWPQSVIPYEKSGVYIASSRNGRVTFIDNFYNISKTWDMPNNGNIKVDSIRENIYVCNTEEVCVYSIKTGDRITSLTGFIAADDLAFDKNKKRLFVLDILKNEIKVYDTLNFQLIKVYEDVGKAPSSILIGEDEKYIYISNKGINKGNGMGNISILNIESGNVSYIDFPKGSVITSLEYSGNFLYVANSGLHRVEVIDILKRRCIEVIKIMLPKLQKLKLSPDKKVLIVIGGEDNGRCVINKITTLNNTIIDRFTFEASSSIPYDIGVSTFSRILVDEKHSILKSINEELRILKEKNIMLQEKLLLKEKEKEKILIEKKIIEKEKESLKKQIEGIRIDSLSKSKKIKRGNEKDVKMEAKVSLAKWLFDD